MTDINKQKFLNELSRLLTFMYEEDRQLALSMYSEALDAAEDEQAVIARLVSPTRQAVVIARAYDAKERKLQIHAQSRADDNAADDGDIPGFVQAIENALPELLNVYDYAQEDGQISLFGEEKQETMPEKEVQPEALQEAEVQRIEAALPEEDDAESKEDIQVEIEVPEEEDNPKAAAEKKINASPDELEDSFDSESEEGPEESEEEKAEAEPSEDKPKEESDDDEDDPDEDASESEDEEEVEDDDEEEEEDDEEDDEEDCHSYPATVLKANLALLILYVIFAVPLGLAGIAVLLIPTMIFLSFAFVTIYSGCAILVATFSGFAVFADIMVMLGLALIVLALGLLFLWLFIWFIGGAMVGLCRGLIELGRKWCYKEVSAE